MTRRVPTPVRRSPGDQHRKAQPSTATGGWRWPGEAQRQRLTGEGPSRRVPARPELVARYGYDVKYASHALRLAYQGLEVARAGRLTLPMPEPERERVLEVKRGEVTDVADVLTEIAGIQRQISRLRRRSSAGPAGTSAVVSTRRTGHRRWVSLLR